MKLPDKLYDILKWIALICLPALALFLQTLLPAYNVDPEVVRVIVLTVNAVAALIGTLIGVSQVKIAQEESKKLKKAANGGEDV